MENVKSNSENNPEDLLLEMRETKEVGRKEAKQFFYYRRYMKYTIYGVLCFTAINVIFLNYWLIAAGIVALVICLRKRKEYAMRYRMAVFFYFWYTDMIAREYADANNDIDQAIDEYGKYSQGTKQPYYLNEDFI
jgi:hypothetical protein